jgi:hypothetical protein
MVLQAGGEGRKIARHEMRNFKTRKRGILRKTLACASG